MDKQIDVWVDRCMGRQIYGQINLQVDRCMDRQIDNQKNRQLDIQINRQVDRKIDRQLDRPRFYKVLNQIITILKYLNFKL